MIIKKSRLTKNKGHLIEFPVFFIYLDGKKKNIIFLIVLLPTF